jgi:hypothetical protein
MNEKIDDAKIWKAHEWLLDIINSKITGFKFSELEYAQTALSALERVRELENEIKLLREYKNELIEGGI